MRSDAFPTPPEQAGRVLLVAHSAVWEQVVRAAVSELGGLPIAKCRPREAVLRLAGADEHISHALVEPACGDGLIGALLELTEGANQADTEVLLLGPSLVPQPCIGVIQSPTIRTVREALMPRPAADIPGEGSMHVAELRAALSSSIVQTRYQPIVRISDRRPVALEALVRLDHPEHGTMMPDRFVPQMEDAGLAHELTGLVSARALDDLAGRLLAGRNLSLSLNFPLDVILQDSALDLLEAQRIAAGIPARKIIVELTESRPVEDFQGLGVSVTRLRQMGYHVAIDDVGPAVPRLDPLLKLAFNGLKLDKGMMLDACTDLDARNFLAVTVQQAHAAGLMVVAEGVETPEIWNLAVALGADMAQGFLVAKPLPVAAVPIWLDSWDESLLPGG